MTYPRPRIGPGTAAPLTACSCVWPLARPPMLTLHVEQLGWLWRQHGLEYSRLSCYSLVTTPHNVIFATCRRWHYISINAHVQGSGSVMAEVASGCNRGDLECTDPCASRGPLMAAAWPKAQPAVAREWVCVQGADDVVVKERGPLRRQRKTERVLFCCIMSSVMLIQVETILLTQWCRRSIDFCWVFYRPGSAGS